MVDALSFSVALSFKSCETVPTVAAVHDFCRFCGVPKVQPAEDRQTMMHARSTISLVVRVISRSKNNFYDVIRLKIMESRYFPKNNGQGWFGEKQTKWRTIESDEMSVNFKCGNK